MTIPQADSMIESGKSLKEIVPIFQTKLAAYQYFGRNMTQRFVSPDPHCVLCGRESDAATVRFTWRANLHTTRTVLISFFYSALAVFAAHLYSRWLVVEFTTFHRFCPPCQRRYRIRRVVVAILNKVLFALLMLLIFLAVPLIIFAFAIPFIGTSGTGWLFVGAVVGAGLLILVVRGFESCRKLLIPEKLRQVGRFPFFLHDVGKIA